MSSYKSNLATLRGALLAIGLMASGGTAIAQNAVNLTAAPTTANLPDGQGVPMWGYSCGAAAAGNTSGATCTAMNGTAQTGLTWQPPLIRAVAGQSLTITLTNSLPVATSIVIDGQLGGGLGNAPTTMASPTHPAYAATWPGAPGSADASVCLPTSTTTPGDAGVFCPQGQGQRVRSFGTEVAAAATTTLTWNTLKAGTYLIHTGTEPSIQHGMGLYGVLVVSETAANNTAYGTAIDADVPVLLSEIDAVQNSAVAAAVAAAGFNERATYAGPGQCKNPDTGAIDATVACYPPAVNYTPTYYLVNGVSFDRGNLAASTLAGPATGASGNILLRIVNAGQRLHSPAIVGTDMTLLGEDGNKVPGSARIQSSIPMPAGKTFDSTIHLVQATAGTYDPAALPLFDRQLSLSTNNQRDGGMQAYISVAGGAPAAAQVTGAANPDTYSVVAGTTLSVADTSRGVMANDVGVYGVKATTLPASGTLTFNANGTFTYVANAGFAGDSFGYCANGATSGALCTTVTINAGTAAAAPVAGDATFTSPVATRFYAPPPGLLASVSNAAGLTLTASAAAVTAGVTVNADGSFTVLPTCAAPCSVSFQYTATNSQNTASNAANVTVNFVKGSGLALNILDGPTATPIPQDYRWIIEEDRTFWIDPACQVNGTNRPATCAPLPVESLGYSFHSAHMPVIATGCVGTVSCEAGQTVQAVPSVCDVGNGGCEPGLQKAPTQPGDVYLDPTKRYFVSILPGDAINPTISGFGGTVKDCAPYSADQTDDNWRLYDPASGTSGNCGHEMGGVQIAPGQLAATINLQQIPLPTAKISVFVFQDDNPLNGENDAGGGVDVIAPNEPGLGGFEIKLFDQAGQLGDNTGQITYDEFNEPVSNSLAGYIDPRSGLDACPITNRGDRLVGMIPTCPKYEADGVTPSPLAGQVVIANLYPGLYEIQAYPAADRIARGEEWVQTNTLDGGKPHEAFIIPDEPGYFQEFGPGGFHVTYGFANPAIINARKAGYCNSTVNASGPSAPLYACNNTLTIQVSNNHMSRTPDQRTFDSGTYDHYAWTQCYVSIGPSDSEDFAFEKCTPDGKVTFKDMPPGVFKMTVFDQWNDIMLDGLVGTVEIGAQTCTNATPPVCTYPGGESVTKSFPVTQWRTNLYTRTYIDTSGDGVSQETEPGLALVNTNIRYRDGSIGFFNNTDLNGYAGFNEVFPYMNWLVVDTTQTRFKPTWTHVVYDAGGPVDCTTDTSILGGATAPPCSTVGGYIANTDVRVKLPDELRVPGAKYCDDADCTGGTFGGASTGILFPAQTFSNSIGWQGLLGQNTFIDFGVKPFKPASGTTPAENGGIHGMVVYASTRPFDDPQLLLQLSWEPGVPNATINLYSKTLDAQGNEVLHLVDTTQTASWDDWAQGFRKGVDGSTLVTAADGGYITNMNCPGQDSTSPFFATLKDSKEWLDAAPKHAIAYHSQFKCYDGWSQLNQAQPAPYDGFYKFPSTIGVDPQTGALAGSHCHVSTTAEPWGCITNPDDGTAMLLAGTYVVEVVPPTGYELVKEEDKNILMGDVYVGPAVQQFGGEQGLGDIYIMPDQAAVGSAYNSANPGALNTTTNIGATPRHEGDTGSVEAFWPCVGALRQVPDYNSEFPGAAQAAPFAGAYRHLCDRKEVKVNDESSTLAKFYLFSSTHIAGHFTGTITNDFASEFDPFSPQFGEKFGPPNLPVGLRDFNGNEVARVYSDQWGIYNGLFFSTWSPNPPNPTGYAPQMSIACMNDPGPIKVGGVDVTDPAYNPAYSNFCYEQPFMPGETTYMDTPVIPTMSFADGYNLPDSEYPDQTPAISVVTTDTSAAGPWMRLASAGNGASVSFTVAGVNRCTNGNGNCNNRTTLTFPGGQVRCDTGGFGGGGNGPNCSSNNQGNRNSAVAGYIRANIGTLLGAGYTASGTGAAVTITSTTHLASQNGTPVITAVANLTTPTAPQALAGGTNPAIAGTATLTINAMGDKVVQNPLFTGPNATTPPYNQKTITRHYGFGAAAGSVVLVGADGKNYPLNGVSWADNVISGTVPATLPPCAMQQGTNYALCGQLVITAANGKRSVDAVTVTVGGSEPWVVEPTKVTAPAGKSVQDYGSNFGRLNLILGATNQSPIQVAIDSAEPGDLILVKPGTYRENLIMWKPVRLQGAGAGSVTVNADAHPAGHMDQWRRQMVCVFGLTLDGIPNLGNSAAAFDTGSTGYSCPDPMFLKGDRIPFEAITGWQAAGNGNLAQVLQEPTLLGAYEGAGITVVGRGIRIPRQSTDFWGDDPTAAGAFPDGAVYLTGSGNDCARPNAPRVDGRDYGTSNYHCNPSRIDGLSVLNSSQGGGGIFVHGWAHNLEIANNRVSSNHGTLAGAINLGNGETPPAFVNDGATCGAGVPALCPPIPAGTPTGGAIPFGFNTFVRIHHNMLWNNASIGDALFTGTPAGAGGVTISAGGDNYSIDHNWIAGNMSTGDGGGVQQLGINFNGRIANNVIMFNQSTNPTLPTNGGGLVVQGANEPRTLNGTECGGATDADCPPGLGDGTGDGLVIDANLIYGNSAESGTGGGVALEMVNGSEVINFPRTPTRWYGVTLTNNIIANNVAGYDGGGVSLRDTLKASLVNNTIISNDTTASAGVLFKTLGAVSASSPPPGCNAQTDPTLPQDPSCLGRDAPHGPQPSGLVTMAHTQNLNDSLAGLPGSITSNFNPKVVCPSGYGYANGTGGGGLRNGDCWKFSRPQLVNDLFWQNRVFSVDIIPPAAGSTTGVSGTGLQSQQNLIALTPMLNQQGFGSCTYGSDSVGTARFWDVGLRTDDVQAGLISAAANRLAITNSILTGAGDIGTANETIASGTNRVGGASPVVAQICNGARTPPEACDLLAAGLGQSCHGYNAPVGASETTSVQTAFVFNNIKPTATVDEGHNWLNLTFGPLTLARPGASGATAGELMVTTGDTGLNGGAYSIPALSSAVGGGAATGLDHDFFGNTRPTSGSVAIGAVERAGTPVAAVSPGSLSFSTLQGTNSATQNLTLSNTGNGPLNGITVTFGGTNAAQFTRNGGTCGTSLGANATCTIGVRFTAPSASGSYSGNVAITGSNGTVTNSPVALTGQSTAPVISAALTPATWTPTATRGIGLLGPAQVFTLTNTGNAPLTGIGQGALGGTNPSQYAIVRLTSTCGPATGGQVVANTTLAPGATCVVTVQFRPTAGAGTTAGLKPATLSVTDAAGTQTSTLSGTAR